MVNMPHWSWIHEEKKEMETVGATLDEIWLDVQRHEANCPERLKDESNVVNIATKKVKVKRIKMQLYKMLCKQGNSEQK